MLNKKIQNKTELKDEINSILKKYSLINAHLESQLIISHSAKKLNYSNVKFDEINIQEIEKILEERLKGRPLSKIIKQKGFWKDLFYTNENTLDPRSDSEVLIENVVKDFNDLKDNQFNFIDLCCGTGCLGISILKEFKSSKCDFIDISNKALSNCRRNIFNLSVDDRSSLFESDLFESYPISKIRNVRFIICNPPYIPTEKYYLLDKETLHDPKISLDGGAKGLDFYIRIIEFLENLQYAGDVYFEIDPLITEELGKFLLEKDPKIVYKKQDYLKLDRLLKITFP